MIITTSSTPSSSSILPRSGGRKAELTVWWRGCGNQQGQNWDKASSRSTAPGSAHGFCSVMDGDELIVSPWSHLIMDLMLGMDPGALPEADWDVLSKASLRGSIPGSRAEASLRYQDKLEEHGSFYGLLRAGQPGDHHKRILCIPNMHLQRFGRE